MRWRWTIADGSSSVQNQKFRRSVLGEDRVADGEARAVGVAAQREVGLRVAVALLVLQPVEERPTQPIPPSLRQIRMSGNRAAIPE